MYGLEASSILRNNKHTGIETSSTRRWFTCCLETSSSTSFWIMGWWAAAAFTLNFQKLQNKGGHDLHWRWWSWTILSTNLLELMLLHCSKKWESIPTWKPKMRMVRRLRTVTHEEHQPLWPSFFLGSADLLPPGWVSVPLSKWGFLAKNTSLYDHRGNPY